MIQAAMITPNLSLGGAERWLTELIVHSDPTKLKWTGVCVSGWGGADEGLVKQLMPHCPLYCSDPGVNRPAHAKPFYREGMTEIMNGDLHAVARKAAQGADVLVGWGSPDMHKWMEWFPGPRVLVSHTTMKDRPGIAITGVTHLAAVSEAASRYFDQYTGNEHLPREIIYNGVNPERCLPSRDRETVRDRMRYQWGIPANAIVVGYIGRQTKEKNFLAAAKAVSALQHPRGAQYYAVYYGMDGTGQKQDDGLRAWCEEHIPGRYLLNDPVDAVGDVLAGLDVLVLASRREAFSLVLIEAWLAGVPVVATELIRSQSWDRYGLPITGVLRNVLPASDGNLDGCLPLRGTA